MKNILAFKRKNTDLRMMPLNQDNHLAQMPPLAMGDLLRASEGRVVTKLLPALKGKKVLLVSPSERPFVKQVIIAEEPAALLQLRFEPGQESESDEPIILAEAQKIPFKKDFFDVVIACVSDQESARSLMGHLTHCLKDDGTFILAVRHPALNLLMQTPQQSTEKESPQIQDYLQEMRESHLYLETLKEGLIQNEVKPFLTMTKNDPHFADYVGIPLVVCFRFVKYVAHEH